MRWSADALRGIPIVGTPANGQALLYDAAGRVLRWQAAGGGGGGGGLNPMGAWSSGVSYSVDDLVTRNGSAYACSGAHTSSGGNAPPSAFWTLYVSKGDPGTPGVPGDPGPTGPGYVAGYQNIVLPDSNATLTWDGTHSAFVLDSAALTASRTYTIDFDGAEGRVFAAWNNGDLTITIVAASGGWTVEIPGAESRAWLTGPFAEIPNRPALIAVGAWSGASIPYLTADVVTYGGGSWRCLVPHTSDAGKAPTNPTYWELLGTLERSGSTTLTFGDAAGPGQQAQVDVTGQTTMLGSSVPRAWIAAVATAHYSVDEHLVAPIQVRCGAPVAGVGFTIYAFSDWRLKGDFTVTWSWS